MDKEAIATSIEYQRLSEQHFHGGYFSEEVRRLGERFKEFTEEEKRAFFQETFNNVFEDAKRLQAHPGFNPSTEGKAIDLSSEGLGTVTIDLTVCDEEEARSEEITPYKGILVFPHVFNPTPAKHSEWINAPGDELGLYTAGPTMVQDDKEPKGFGEHIFAGLDGSFQEDEGDIDYEVMRLLDAKETLDLVQEALGMQV